METVISVIIPVKNGQRTIKKCIDSILALPRQDVETIIIDDASTDETPKILASYGDKITVLRSNGTGPSRARNMAIAQAKGAYVAFTDADCVVDTLWLNELMKGFSSIMIAAVGGDQRSPADDSAFGKQVHGFLKAVGFIADYVKSDSVYVVPTDHNPTCNVMYRTKVLLEAGGFCENLWPGEDLELDHRLKKNGWKFMYNPRAAVYHYRPGSMEAFIRMMTSYGRVQGVLVRWYGPFRMLHYLPFTMGMCGILMLVLWGIEKTLVAAAVSAVVVGIYLFKRSGGQVFEVIAYSKLLVQGALAWNRGYFAALFSRHKQ